MVIVRLPVQLAQRNRLRGRPRLSGVLQEINRRLVVKQIVQPELHIRGEIAVVDLGDDLRAICLHAHLRRGKRRHRAQVLRVHAEGNHRAGRRVRQRDAAQRPQRKPLRQRVGQRTNGRVALRLADGVDKRLRLPRPVDDRAGGQLAELVEIFRPLVQRIQRFKRHALARQPFGHAVPARAQQQPVRAFQRVVHAQSEHLAAVRPERRYGYDMLFAVHYSLSALFSTLSMMKRGRRLVSL